MITRDTRRRDRSRIVVTVVDRPGTTRRIVAPSVAPTAGSKPEIASQYPGVVRFGLFYEHQLPRPWSDDSEFQLLQHALEQCELADALGIQYVWEVEHHFLEEHFRRARV
jgi:hypothetical protein